jgi:signal transduction histidine kinase
MFDRIFGQPSGRVVAIARVGLASVFLLATFADPRVGQSPIVMPTLTAFFCFAVLVSIITWRNWWIDARIAVATHLIDIGFFMTMIASPEGYSSPYFLFFVFLLLSAAIRWEWRETALTSLAVIALYVLSGLLVAQSAEGHFETRRFLIRSGDLLILSAVLIWFGVRRRFSGRSSVSAPAVSEIISDEPPLAVGLRQSMQVTMADDGLATWTFPDGKEATSAASGRFRGIALPPVSDLPALEHSFLFDLKKNRALVNTPSGAPQFTSATALLGDAAAAKLPRTQGIGIPVKSTLGRGLFLVWGVRNLHSDHLALGDRLRFDLAYLIERLELLSALRESAIARERLSLARDLHDGIVQFLAGSAYRVEAISQSSTQGSDVSADLQELKQLMLLEQEDLRSSIGTLRRDKVSLTDTASEAESLSDRLSRHWHVRCSFTADVPDLTIPARLHADVLHMIKEGVANAVRHASAENLRVGLKADGKSVELIITNDGVIRTTTEVPWSIRERMIELGGLASVSAGDGINTVSVVVPIPGVAR